MSYYRRIPARPACCPQPRFEPLSEESMRRMGREMFPRRYVMSPGWNQKGTVWMWLDDTFRHNTFESEADARKFVAQWGIEDRVEWRL